MMKTCGKCKKEQEETEFHKRGRGNGDSRHSKCRTCCEEYQKEYRIKNKEKNVLYKREYQKKNSKRLAAISKEYAQKNREHVREYKRQYNERRRILRKKRYDTDPMYRLVARLRGGIRRGFKQKGWTKDGFTMSIIGCTYEVAKKHIERQFTKGMTWKKLMAGEIHIDHKIPMSSAKTPEELKTLCHYTNLQPLWALDNLQKNMSIPEVQMKIAI